MMFPIRDQTVAELSLKLGTSVWRRRMLRGLGRHNWGVVMNAWKKSVLGGVMAGALLMGGGAVPAQAAGASSISDGTIIGGGTAVQGTYNVTCEYEGQEIIALITLAQRQGKTVNSTFQQEPSFYCPSAGEFSRTYTVFGRAPYKPGSATLRLGVESTNPDGSRVYVDTVKEIRLSR